MTKLKTKDIEFLQSKALEIRKQIMLMSFSAQSAHVGGALSCVELLVSLYFKIMRIFLNDNNNDKRDRFVLSKAHDCKALYATLAERGFFSKSILKTYEQNNGRLPGHSTRHCVPGVEVSAGSLGHGLSMAAGMALRGKIDKKKFRVFALLSDGECDEGSTWEAILFAGHHKLENLVAIVDYNGLQAFGTTKEVLDLEPFKDKWEDFGWAVKEINGNDFNQIIKALEKIPFKEGKPSVLIARTIKGLGGPAEEVGELSSHYKPISKKNIEDLHLK